MKRIELENGCYKKTFDQYIAADIKFKYVEYYNSKYKFHRLNGPAIIIYKDNKIIRKKYWINGKKYSKKEFNKVKNIERNLKLLDKK